MSKKRKKDLRENANEIVTLSLSSDKNTEESSVVEPTDNSGISNSGVFTYLRTHLWVVGVIAFLTLGTLGAGLKYLDDDAQREIAKRASIKGNLNNQKQSFLNQVNPFLPSPTPTPTPQLSKEYIYAGSRLLAVEDANATAAPPADLAIWRPLSGEWWVMGQTGSQQVTQAWGINGDDPVPGDYDGDGKTDFAVFRPDAVNHTGTWYITNSGGGGGQFTFGIDTDKPAQADYDGDGRTDVAVFRPSIGTWHIQQSSNYQTLTVQFGLSSDLPAPADYDGDGKADIGVWRSSDTAFYSLNSSNNQLQTPTLNQSGNKVVSADYDGDGRADYAVYNSATAYWYIRQSTNNQVVGYQWGTGGDKPVPNDYDGDGKVDIAVWHAADGVWTIRNSATNTTRTAQWGGTFNGIPDVPVPAYYRR